jgi:hypothetical protein
MKTWFYKAASSKLDQPGTVLFASKGFLARSAHDLKNRSAAERVRQVEAGDVVHFYYVKSGKSSAIGAYTVVDKLDSAPWVREPIEGTALFKVDTAFVRAVDTAGVYEQDPVLHAFTGWLIKRIGPALPYEASRFPGQTTLVQG